VPVRVDGCGTPALHGASGDWGNDKKGFFSVSSSKSSATIIRTGLCMKDHLGLRKRLMGFDRREVWSGRLGEGIVPCGL